MEKQTGHGEKREKMAASLWDALLALDFKPVADKIERVKSSYEQVVADVEAIKIGTGRPSKQGTSCLKRQKNKVRKHVDIRTSWNRVRYID